MDNLNLNNNEITIINDALNGRINTVPINDESNIKTQGVLSSFIQEGNEVKPKYRPWLIGCINDYFINPNKELFLITEYDAIMASDEVLLKMKELDQALALITKLQKKSEKPRKLFHEKYSKLSGLGKIEKILFSETTYGKLYKIGILFSNGQGIRYDNETLQFKKIIVENIAINEYEAQLMPVQFMGKLDAKSKVEDLGPVLLQVNSLIQKFS